MAYDAPGPGKPSKTPNPILLDSVVEIDKTYIGGLEANKHWGKKLQPEQGTAHKPPDSRRHRTRQADNSKNRSPAISGEILEAFVAATVKETAVAVTTTTPDTGTYPNSFNITPYRTTPENNVKEDIYTNTIKSAQSTPKAEHQRKHKNLPCL